MAIRKVVTAKQPGAKPLTAEQRASAEDRKKREAWVKIWEERPKYDLITQEELVQRGLFSLIFRLGRDTDGRFQNEVARPINKAYQKCNPEAFAAVAAERGFSEEEFMDKYPMTRQICSKIINGQQRKIDIAAMEAIACFHGWSLGELYDYLIDLGREDVAANGDFENLTPLKTTGPATSFIVLDTVETQLKDGLVALENLRDVLVSQESQIGDFAQLVQYYRQIWPDEEIVDAAPENSGLTKEKLSKLASGVLKADDSLLTALHIAFNSLEKTLPDDDTKLSIRRETLQLIRDRFLPQPIELQEEKPGRGRRLAIANSARPPMM
jgi:hypothetical protein